MRIRLGYSNVLYLCVCFSAVANASPEEERAMAAPRLQAEEARNSVREIAEGLKNEPYFDQAKLALVFARLESAKNSRRYETADPVKFAQLVTEDMQAASKDTHLYLSFNPGWYRSAVAPEDPARTAEQNAYEENIARITNFGLSETRILTGNVRYLRIDGFSWIEKEAVPTFDAVIDFLKGGRAIIIDVRNNRGGDTNALYYLMGHFFKPDDLMLTWIAPGKPDMQVRASPFLRSSLVGIPTYVLVNARSRSAAEALAWTVKQFKIGDVVGEIGRAHV